MLARCPACNSENILIGSATSDCLSCEHSWITERAARLRSVQAYECWSLDDLPEPCEERVEGYLDGFGHAPEPGANRSPAYWHGWLCGASDRGRIEARPWMRALAAQTVERGKSRRLKQLNGSRA